MKKIINKLVLVFIISICTVPFMVFAISNFVEDRIIKNNYENLKNFKNYWDIELEIQKELRNEFETRTNESMKRQRMLHESAEN